ncbi:MAG TPA: hypothetical protein VFT50_09405 [Baekduia sp.]|nr:hypothetical protein [Baekduia sp.]
MEIKAAVETGLVESNLRNLPGGDADSQGWRQERASLYPNPRNLNASINRFFDETSAVEGRYPSAGDLAAAVQRPAAQYRGRYAERSAEADKLIGRHGGGGRSHGGGSLTIDVPQLDQSFDAEGFERARRRAIVGEMIARHNPNSLLLKAGALSTQMPSMGDFVTSKVTTTSDKLKLPPIPGQGHAGKGPEGGPAAAVAAAVRRLGIGEQGGNNRGPKVDRWEQKYGMLGQPWCGIFVGLALEHAGVAGITSRVASVSNIEQDAKAGANGFASWHSPQHAHVGDALVTAPGQHVGLVVGVHDGVIDTIEGNTSTGKVERRSHRADEVYGVARPAYR